VVDQARMGMTFLTQRHMLGDPSIRTASPLTRSAFRDCCFLGLCLEILISNTCWAWRIVPTEPDLQSDTLSCRWCVCPWACLGRAFSQGLESRTVRLMGHVPITASLPLSYYLTGLLIMVIWRRHGIQATSQTRPLLTVVLRSA